MATGIVREYIGARYVPKFFENENNTPEWAPNVQYEPLTIVTYNQNSYTSKKPVPASVGNPSDNPTYWASTGNYNAQVEAYRQEVVQFKNDILDQIGTVSPMDYGAIGDGVTDDSAAVQAAGAAGIVFDPDHVYYIGRTVTLVYGAKDTNFYLDKDAMIRSESGKAIYIGNKIHKNPAELDDGTRGQWSLNVANQKPICIMQNEIYNVVSGIYVEYCSGIIADNYIHNVPQLGLSAGGNGYGILLIGCEGISICNNLFKDVGRHEVYLSIDTTPSPRNRNINIHDNVFRRTSATVGSTSGQEMCISIRPSVNVHIHHNIFDGVQSVCNGNMQVTGDAAYALGTEGLFIDSNIINASKNTVRPADGIFTFGGKPAGADGHVYTNVFITNNLLTNIEQITNSCIMKIQSVKNICVKGNRTMNCSFALGVNMSDMEDQNNPENISFIDNDFGYVDSFFIRCTGTGRNMGKMEFIGNKLDVYYFMQFPTNTVITEFTCRDNVFKVAGNNNATNNATLSKVSVSGNSSNMKLTWAMNIANAEWLDYDNTFAPLAAGTYPNMRRGAVLAFADHTIGIVQDNGTIKVLS